MTSSHTVDFLSSGFVVKTAMSEMFNGKLKAEVDQIRALHDIYPELMVPVLHDGLAAGRQFYILEKMDSLPLCNIVFDDQRSLAERRMIVRNALESVQKAIGLESEAPSTMTHDMPARLLEEWEGTRFAHELFDKPILLNGARFCITAREVFEKSLELARTEEFRSVEKAHFNFHFGNVLYNEEHAQTRFIDPDFSVRGLDPLFGFSRFAFSFWHELAAEVKDAVKMVPMTDALMFVLAKPHPQRDPGVRRYFRSAAADGGKYAKPVLCPHDLLFPEKYPDQRQQTTLESTAFSRCSQPRRSVDAGSADLPRRAECRD